MTSSYKQPHSARNRPVFKIKTDLATKRCVTEANRPNSRTPKCTCPTFHNAPFRAAVCTFLFSTLCCGIRGRCIVGLVRSIYSYVLNSQLNNNPSVSDNVLAPNGDKPPFEPMMDEFTFALRRHLGSMHSWRINIAKWYRNYKFIYELFVKLGLFVALIKHGNLEFNNQDLNVACLLIIHSIAFILHLHNNIIMKKRN